MAPHIFEQIPAAGSRQIDEPCGGQAHQTRTGVIAHCLVEQSVAVPCRAWDLQVERVIKQRFACPEFREAHGKARCYADPANFFGTPAFEQLDVICNGRIGKERPEGVAPTSIWLNGVDTLNLVNNSKRKTTVYGIKCEELPPDIAYTHSGFHAFLIIEGPEEASVQRWALQRTIQVMCKHAPIPSPGTLPCTPRMYHILLFVY
jgi:hypothetical protein